MPTFASKNAAMNRHAFPSAVAFAVLPIIIIACGDDPVDSAPIADGGALPDSVSAHTDAAAPLPKITVNVDADGYIVFYPKATAAPDVDLGLPTGTFKRGTAMYDGLSCRRAGSIGIARASVPVCESGVKGSPNVCSPSPKTPSGV